MFSCAGSVVDRVRLACWPARFSWILESRPWSRSRSRPVNPANEACSSWSHVFSTFAFRCRPSVVRNTLEIRWSSASGMRFTSPLRSSRLSALVAVAGCTARCLPSSVCVTPSLSHRARSLLTLIYPAIACAATRHQTAADSAEEAPGSDRQRARRSGIRAGLHR